MANRLTALVDKLTGADRRMEQVATMAATNAVEKATHTFTSADFFSGRPMPNPGGNTAEAYSNSWVAHSCIRRISTDAAGIPLLVLRDPLDPESAVPDSHPLASLLREPSPDFSSSEMIQWLVMWLQLRGEFFLHFDNPMAPREVIVWRDPLHWREGLTDGRVTQWQYRKGDDGFTLPRSAVLQHRFVNPANPWRGLAPIQAAALPYGIDTGAERLQKDVIDRGGERAVIYSFPADLTVEQRDQALSMLRGRRLGDGTVARDTALPAGASIVDPRFTENDLSILDSQKMQPDKICAVFGMSKSLLGIEDIDKYATFQGRLRVYFQQTLIPMLHGIESSFDSYLRRYMTGRWFGHVRFDMRSVEALFQDQLEQFTTANLAHAGGIPWTECNRRFKLGLELDNVPGADMVLVSMGTVPLDRLVAEWDEPAPEPEPPMPPEDDDDDDLEDDPEAPEDAPAGRKGLTQAIINKRAGDARASLQRTVRLAKAEQALRGEYRKAIGAAAKRTQRLVAGATTPEQVNAAVNQGMAGLDEKVADLVGKYHERAAREGARSIVEIVAGKMSDQELEVWKVRAPWRPQVEDFIKQRKNLIKGMVGDLFNDVLTMAVEAVRAGTEGDSLVKLVAERFGSAPGGLTRAVTIARTEIGSAYSVARNAEMTGQGFEKHQWLTANDEQVRDGDEPGEFDHNKCNGEVGRSGRTSPAACRSRWPPAARPATSSTAGATPSPWSARRQP